MTSLGIPVDMNGTQANNSTQTVVPQVVRDIIAPCFVVLAVGGASICLVMLSFLIKNDRRTFVPVGRVFVSLFSCVLLIIITAIPITTVKIVMEEWEFDHVTCLSMGVLRTYLYWVYALHLLLLLFETYISLKNLDQDLEYVAKRSCYSLIIVLIWVLAGVLCIMMFIGNSQISYVPGLFTCEESTRDVTNGLFIVICVLRSAMIFIAIVMILKITTMRKAGISVWYHLHELNFPAISRQQLRFKKQLKWLKSTLAVTMTNYAIEVVTLTLFTVGKFFPDPEFYYIDTIRLVVEFLALSFIPFEFIFSNRELTEKIFKCRLFMPAQNDGSQDGVFRIVVPSGNILQPRSSLFITDHDSPGNIFGRDENPDLREVERPIDLEVMENTSSIVHTNTINLRSEIRPSLPTNYFTEQIAMRQLSSPTAHCSSPVPFAHCSSPVSFAHCSSPVSFNATTSTTSTAMVHHIATSGEFTRAVTPVGMDRLPVEGLSLMPFGQDPMLQALPPVNRPVSPREFTTTSVMNYPECVSLISTTVNELGQVQPTAEVYFDRGSGSRSPSFSVIPSRISQLPYSAGTHTQVSTHDMQDNPVYMTSNLHVNPHHNSAQYRQFNPTQSPSYQTNVPQGTSCFQHTTETHTHRTVPNNLQVIQATPLTLARETEQRPLQNFVNNFMKRRHSNSVADSTVVLVYCTNGENPQLPQRDMDHLFVTTNSPCASCPDLNAPDHFEPKEPNIPTATPVSEQWRHVEPTTPTKRPTEHWGRSPADFERKIVPPPTLVLSGDIEDDVYTIDATNQYDETRKKVSTDDLGSSHLVIKSEYKTQTETTSVSEIIVQNVSNLPLHEELGFNDNRLAITNSLRETSIPAFNQIIRPRSPNHLAAQRLTTSTFSHCRNSPTNISTGKSHASEILRRRSAETGQTRKESLPTRPNSVVLLRPKRLSRQTSEEDGSTPLPENNAPDRGSTPVPRTLPHPMRKGQVEVPPTDSVGGDCLSELPKSRARRESGNERKEMYHPESMVYLGMSTDCDDLDEV